MLTVSVRCQATQRQHGDTPRVQEFAVILPVLAMLVVGVVEIGFAFKEKLLVDNAIQVAARTGSVLGQSDDVDLRILEALEQGFTGLPGKGDGIVLQAQVYKVNIDGTTDPTKVNTYLFSYNPSPAICNWNPCPATPAQHGVWQPLARDTKLDGGLDSLGVTVFYGHDWLLGSQFFLGDVSCGIAVNCWTETAIMRLEPTE